MWIVGVVVNFVGSSYEEENYCEGVVVVWSVKGGGGVNGGWCGSEVFE